MYPQKKLTVLEIAAHFADHLESQYFVWEVQSISDIVFVNGFTVATVTYTTTATEPYSDNLRLHTRRWSFRREDWDNRIISYFHDEAANPSI